MLSTTNSPYPLLVKPTRRRTCLPAGSSVQQQNATQYCRFNTKMQHSTVSSTSKCTTILSVQHQNAPQYCRFNIKMQHSTVGSTPKCTTTLSVQHQNATQYCRFNTKMQHNTIDTSFYPHPPPLHCVDQSKGSDAKLQNFYENDIIFIN